MLMILPFVGVKSSKAISSSNEFSVVWFVVNGAIIHIFLDGMIGGLRLCDPLFNAYSYLDSRYII